jgi:hypothetical protein
VDREEEAKKEMSKTWPKKQFTECEPSIREFLEDQEKKLDADRAWQPRTPPTPEIGGERAIPLEDDHDSR